MCVSRVVWEPTSIRHVVIWMGSLKVCDVTCAVCRLLRVLCHCLRDSWGPQPTAVPNVVKHYIHGLTSPQQSTLM
jgi:hypothetical protein